MSVKVVKMADMPLEIALDAFKAINAGMVEVRNSHEDLAKGKIGNIPDVNLGTYIITSTEPKDLTYPEGWYYGKGCFRNKHNASGIVYQEVTMLTPHGKYWREKAPYCTGNEEAEYCCRM